MEVAVNHRQFIRDMYPMPEAAVALLEREGSFEAWFQSHGRFKELLPLDQFRTKYEGQNVENFVYLREKGVVFNTLNYGGHHDFMSGIYVLKRLSEGWVPTEESLLSKFNDSGIRDMQYWNDEKHPGVPLPDNQEMYLEKELGVYQSGCGKVFYRHKNFQPNAVEFNTFYNLERWHVYGESND